jgi:hypothetical protein
MGEITCKVWELALTTLPANGAGPLPPDVAWLLSAVAVSAPAAAVRCPRVLAALPPGAREEVRLLAERDSPSETLFAPPVTATAREASPEADSETLTTQEAGRALGITTHGARAACRRGHLAGTVVDGKWRIDRAALEDYRRDHAGARGAGRG